MLQTAGGLGLTKETLKQVRIIGVAAGHHLDGYEAVQIRIGGLVNHTHAATTDDVDDVVLTDFCRFIGGHDGPTSLCQFARHACSAGVADGSLLLIELWESHETSS